MDRGSVIRTLAIIGLVMLPHRQMLLDAFVSTGLPYEICVVRCKARKMCCILFTCSSRPLAAVVIMPKCEDAITAYMEVLDECGNRISRLYLVSLVITKQFCGYQKRCYRSFGATRTNVLDASLNAQRLPWFQNSLWHVDIDLQSSG